MRCETARALKLCSQGGMGTVEPLSFIVPRKSEAFQDDIFPPTFSGKPSMTSDEWLGGAPPKAPMLMSLDPSDGGKEVEAKAVAAPAAIKPAAVLMKELDAAMARIKVLEAALTAAGAAIPPGGPDAPPPPP